MKGRREGALLGAEERLERTEESARGMREREKDTLGRGAWQSWRIWRTAGSVAGLGVRTCGEHSEEKGH